MRGRKGEVFYLNAPRTSSLINGKADIPKALKHPLRRYGIVDGTVKNMGAFIEDYIGEDGMSFLMDEILSSFELGDEVQRRLRDALVGLREVPSRFLATVLIESLKRSNIATTRRLLWQHGSGSLSVEVGDLISKGFGRRRKK